MKCAGVVVAAVHGWGAPHSGAFGSRLELKGTEGAIARQQLQLEVFVGVCSSAQNNSQYTRAAFWLLSQ